VLDAHNKPEGEPEESESDEAGVDAVPKEAVAASVPRKGCPKVERQHGRYQHKSTGKFEEAAKRTKKGTGTTHYGGNGGNVVLVNDEGLICPMVTIHYTNGSPVVCKPKRIRFPETNPNTADERHCHHLRQMMQFDPRADSKYDKRMAYNRLNVQRQKDDTYSRADKADLTNAAHSQKDTIECAQYER
jgi:hypothetical protein